MFLVAALVLAAVPDPGVAACAPCAVVATPLEGFQRVLFRKPAILAVGEYPRSAQACTKIRDRAESLSSLFV